MEVDPGQRASSIRRKRPSLPSARKGVTEQPGVVVGMLPGVGGILAPPEGGQDARAREPSLAMVDEQPRVRARRPRLGLPRPAQLSGMLSGNLLHVPRHEGPAARGSTCIVSHRCSREHVHRWSLLSGVARAYLRQSPLLKGARASSPPRRRRSREDVQSPLLGGARAGTAARGARASIAAWMACASSCQLVAAAPTVGRTRRRSPRARDFAWQGTPVRRWPVSALAVTAAR